LQLKAKPMNEKEVTTVLYALRFLQANYDDTIVDGMKSGGLLHFEEHPPLISEEIDELCSRLALGLEAEVCRVIGTCNREKHEGCVRGFYQQSRSYYKQIEEGLEEINFGMFHPQGGTSGEMIMRWLSLGNDKNPVARLECFEDAWDVLSCYPDLLEKMAELDGTNPQPEDFVRILLECGFTDLTKEKRPVELLVDFRVFSHSMKAEMPSVQEVLDCPDAAVIQVIVKQELYIVVAKEGDLRLKSVHVDREAAIAAHEEWIAKGGITGLIAKAGLF